MEIINRNCEFRGVINPFISMDKGKYKEKNHFVTLRKIFYFWESDTQKNTTLNTEDKEG